MFASAPSYASLIDFTLSGSGGQSIAGQINGLQNIAGAQTATSVLILSYVDIGKGFPGSFTVPYTFVSVSANSFTFANGTITDAHFHGYEAGNPATDFFFDLYPTITAGTNNFQLHSYNNQADVQGTNLAFTAFTSPVPLPAAVWLFGTGLLGLTGFARKRSIA